MNDDHVGLLQGAARRDSKLEMKAVRKARKAKIKERRVQLSVTHFEKKAAEGDEEARQVLEKYKKKQEQQMEEENRPSVTPSVSLSRVASFILFG